MRLLSIAALLCGSFSSLADIPPPPSDPVGACENMKIGDHCSYYAQGFFSGTCQTKDTALTCIADTPTATAAEKNVESIHAKEASATDANTPHSATDATDDKTTEAQAAPQGCTNFGPLSTSFLSLMSVIMGLFMAMRFRKR